MFKDSKIPYIKLLPLLVISFILFKMIDNIGLIYSYISAFFSLIGSFIWAFGIAYVLNPMLKYLERKFKMKRAFSLIITYAVFIGAIVLFITIVTPRLIKSIGELVSSIPYYLEVAKEWLTNNAQKFEALNKLNINVESKFLEYMEHASNYVADQLNTILSKTLNITYSFVKAILGIIISIYILNDKEIFKINFKKFIYALMKPQNAYSFLKTCSEINCVFSKFILGKALDSLIIGILCFIGLSIMRVHFSALLSVIVCITNMIPYFGPFLGMIPAFVITLFYSPIKAFWVLVFVFLLQQFDGWYLGPKILGDQVGLSPFWIIAAIIVGGGIFGIWGMFLGVPVVAVIKVFLDRYIDHRLAEKKIKVT